MRAIVAVTSNWAIGCKGNLLISNKADMQHFVQHTKDGTVIMGRTTLESFPGANPLPKRRNIVLTHDTNWSCKGAEVVHSVSEALTAASTDNPDKVWCIGGMSVYEQLLRYCDEVIVTMHDIIVPADAYFPNLDEDPHWMITASSEKFNTPSDISFRFVTYKQV
ncbi:dihydrofolate reductase [Atopobium fossor]|uniref:dihydrofolate reductase n=1 Tax=Atopobium fossor TaxID=39487 RepID=UPI000415D2DA|nr:dihydrofolate reductase [Atopobium fossor]